MGKTHLEMKWATYSKWWIFHIDLNLLDGISWDFGNTHGGRIWDIEWELHNNHN